MEYEIFSDEENEYHFIRHIRSRVVLCKVNKLPIAQLIHRALEQCYLTDKLAREAKTIRQARE
jgi:hypothetical protein